jgi:hypothetical protein
VDVGEYWLVATQGSILQHFPDPRLFLLSKTGQNELIHLCDVPRLSERTTGFTYSRTSRTSKDGVFFSHRSLNDGFIDPSHIFRWEITIS